MCYLWCDESHSIHALPYPCRCARSYVFSLFFRPWYSCTTRRFTPMVGWSHPTVWWTAAGCWKSQIMGCGSSRMGQNLIMISQNIYIIKVSPNEIFIAVHREQRTSGAGILLPLSWKWRVQMTSNSFQWYTKEKLHAYVLTICSTGLSLLSALLMTGDVKSS